MNWRRCTATSIISDDDRYKVSKCTRYYKTEQRETVEYDAWGPPGSQRVDYIAKTTADRLRDLGREVQPELLALKAGRAHLGHFDSADEARAACEEHAAGTRQAALL